VKGKRILIWAGILLAIYTLQALLYVPQTYFSNIQANPSFTWLTALAVTLIPFYLFILLAPPVIWLAMRFTFESSVWLKSLLVHIPASLTFAVLHLILLPLANTLLIEGRLIENYRSPLPRISLLLSFGAGNIVQYWIIVIVCQAVNYFRKFREREESLALAQLQALKTQLHPHFLFNTLNAISELVYEDSAQAEKTITRLSELLRFSLKTDQAQEVPLHEELEFLRMYIEIQQTLLQERLQVRWRIAPETFNACVPSMILQPLVENSIRHGIAPLRSGGTIKIISTKENGWLVLNVEDDGLGLTDKSTNGKGVGIGLQNTQTRLKRLYGERHEFDLKMLSAKDRCGTWVEIKLPFREEKRKYEPENSDFNS
jgi:sensor histidine kinase YesM